MNERTASTCCSGRVRLDGVVAGVPSCAVISDAGQLVVGSSADCDLTVADPLAPARAFRLRRIKDHADATVDCRSYWMLEALHGTRIFINGILTRRGKIHFGDIIHAGCHRFAFNRDTDAPRDLKTRVNTADICAQLAASMAAPAGFLNLTPDRMARRRALEALKWTLLATLVLMILLRVTPRPPAFVDVQPGLEIVMIGPVAPAVQHQSVRTLEQTQRVRTEDTDPAVMEDPELAALRMPVIQSQRPEWQPMATAEATPQPTDPAFERPDLAATPDLPPMPREAAPPPAFERAATVLTPTTPRRRLSAAEAENPVLRSELAQMNIRVRPAAAQAPAFAGATERVAVNVAPAPLPAFSAQQRAAILAGQQPSPLTFEEYRGTRIPVARAPAQLETMDGGGDRPGVEFDGKVSEHEMAMSWKSGRFNIHGANPQPASPPTYCYVGRADLDGVEHLYVSFVCEDPDVGAIRHGSNEGPWRDDSVEIFLDHNGNRRDYHHLIVTAHGRYHARYLASGDLGISNQGAPWNVSPRIKTAISREAGRWTAEIMVPFSHLGGAPRKGDRWHVNFTRSFRGQNNPGGVYQNWFLVYDGKSPNYHNPQLFGALEW